MKIPLDDLKVGRKYRVVTSFEEENIAILACIKYTPGVAKLKFVNGQQWNYAELIYSKIKELDESIF